MAKEFSRTQRIAGQIQRELAQLIQREVRDPRLGMVTISHVDVTRDLAHAKVYITVMGENPEQDQAVAILNKVAGYLRHALGQRIKIRTLPELHFFYDQALARSMRVSNLIEQAVAGDRSKKSS